MTKLNLWRDETSQLPIPNWDNFSREIERMMNEMDRMLSPMRSSMLEPGRWSEESMVNIPVSLEEAEDHYVLSFDIPGVPKEDVSIEVLDNQLIITGERKRQQTRSEGGIYRNERRFGKFRQVFTLPDVIDSEQLEATYDNGVLHLSLPKGQEAKPKKIAINEGKGGSLKRLVEEDKEKEAMMTSQQQAPSASPQEEDQLQQVNDSQKAV